MWWEVLQVHFASIYSLALINRGVAAAFTKKSSASFIETLLVHWLFYSVVFSLASAVLFLPTGSASYNPETYCDSKGRKYLSSVIRSNKWHLLPSPENWMSFIKSMELILFCRCLIKVVSHHCCCMVMCLVVPFLIRSLFFCEALWLSFTLLTSLSPRKILCLEEAW